jgi:uncharacterized protein (TIGR02646 family)
MRRVIRHDLSLKTSATLSRRQMDVSRQKDRGTLNIDSHWSAARRTKYMGEVLRTLHRMAGERQRCMYCLDSHGTDIEHFRPKAVFHEYIYIWGNLLLACSGCNTLKREQFPVVENEPLLINPTVEDPWQFLDYEPNTGIITAKFDVQMNDFMLKGTETVKILHLDRREALENGRKKTFADLQDIAKKAICEIAIDPVDLLREFNRRDEYGLLSWCLSPSGLQHPTFNLLAAKHPDAVTYLVQNA